LYILKPLRTYNYYKLTKTQGILTSFTTVVAVSTRARQETKKYYIVCLIAKLAKAKLTIYSQNYTSCLYKVYFIVLRLSKGYLLFYVSICLVYLLL